MARSANTTSAKKTAKAAAQPRPKRSSKFGEIDPRLANMSQEALVCRGVRHAPQWIPTGAKRRAELAKLDQMELRRQCINCGYTSWVVYDRRERVIVERRTEYPEGYLMPKEFRGTGRISQWDAYAALQ